MKTKSLWEILVPCQRDGKPVTTRSHKAWDRFVFSLTGGVSIFKPLTAGKWVNPANNELVVERMIPVRIVCTETEIKKIIDFTLRFYNQEAVLAYEISNKVILKAKNETDN